MYFYGDAQALDRVSLTVDKGAIVAIVGANGAGKTSLIRTIAGMQGPAHGRILYRGVEITGWPSHKICDLGIGQVARGPPGVSLIVCGRKSCDGRHACACPRLARDKILRKSMRCFQYWQSAAINPQVHSRVASNRCLPSADA